MGDLFQPGHVRYEFQGPEDGIRGARAATSAERLSVRTGTAGRFWMNPVRVAPLGLAKAGWPRPKTAAARIPEAPRVAERHRVVRPYRWSSYRAEWVTRRWRKRCGGCDRSWTGSKRSDAGSTR
jgi:hypothetical protein